MNVILVIIDSLRLDHIGCYADCYPYPIRAKTPNMDRLSTESLRFRRAAPESLPTLPMRRAIHTGQRLWPFWGHVSYKGDFVGAPGWGPMFEEQVTLAEMLSGAGYRTGFVTDTYHQFKPSKNFHRGFAEWHWIRGQEGDPYRRGPYIPDEEVLKHIPKRNWDNKWFVARHREYLMNVAERKSEEDYFPAQVFRTGANWLYRNADAKKFFLVLDSFDPHEPWDPPAYYRDMYTNDKGGTDIIWLDYGRPKHTKREFARVRANYAGEVTMVDHWFGHFYDAFLASGRADDTLLILTTDHGHYLGDQGHTGKGGYPMLREIIDTPILIRHPKGKLAGRTNDAFAYHHDISATILDACKVKPQQKLDGESLMPVFGGSKGPKRKYTLTAWGPFVGIRDSKWYYNSTLWGHKPLLFDIKNDPTYSKNVASKHPDVVKEMHAIGQADCGGKYPEFLRKEADAALPGCTPLGKW